MLSSKRVYFSNSDTEGTRRYSVDIKGTRLYGTGIEGVYR